MRPRLLSLFIALALVAVACGGDDGGGNDGGGAGGSTTTAADAASADPGTDGDTPVGESRPEVAIPDGDAPTELVVTDLVEGDGAEATDGSGLTLHYVGVLFDGGEEFDASWDRGPFQVVLGAGRVIPGWDQGLVGMREGGRRRLVIPPDLAYGDTGQGSIPPGATLVFVVDLLEVDEPVDPADEPDIDVPAEPATQLEVTDLVEGDGAAIKRGDTAEVLLAAALQSTGEVIESAWRTGGLAVELPVGRTIPGLDQGLEGMMVGGTRHIVVPPDLGYGAEGSGDGVIGPDETIVFVVQLVDLTPAEYESVDAADEPTPEPPAQPATELGITDLDEGDGAAVTSGDTVAVHYVGVSQSTGEVFDSSWPAGQPVEFPIGLGSVIAGWDEGLVGMKVGGRRQLVIPGDLAYGEAGRPPAIGPNDTLVFVIDLVAIVDD